VLALCEFESLSAAHLGTQLSHSLFDALLPNRVLIENANTLLTLAGEPSPAAAREAELARSLFMALTPSGLEDE
jgi:hypothetical protein